ncbi:DUF1538 domain-containing protein [Rubrobacter indicoceani]|uniref:DUF1538 domain-containing protein n=1 Tax=Rubrobacter indicoceani TaxID=2051957 RepID=UPI000E5B0897|nr:DUF1538 domain-containing protein [Rubrobacter indicoceani]
MNPLRVFDGYPETLLEVLFALAPLLVLLLVFQGIAGRSALPNLPRMLMGIVLSIFGLSLFLQGVHVGFLPFGEFTGAVLSSVSYSWILIPVGFVLGFASIIAEPAVRVLNYEVEKLSTGSIRSTPILITLAVGVGFAVALAMARILYGIPLWGILVPGYLLAFALTWFSSDTFTSIAFDSGGVATGPMTVTFILSLAVGAATGLEGRDPVVEGFGLVALVALAPILAVLILGIIYRIQEGGSNPTPEKEEQRVETSGGA